MKAKTLYEACEQAVEAIELQPLNYSQEHWANPIEDIVRFHYMDGCEDAAQRAKEACGTAYCRAGHIMCAVKDGPVTAKTAESGARKLMVDEAKIPIGEVMRLFGGGAAGPKESYGTEEYVRRGADGLREFMQKYEEQLKSVDLTVDLTAELP